MFGYTPLERQTAGYAKITEEQRKAEKERKELLRKKQEAEREAERVRLEKELADVKQQSTYRESYDAGKPKTFEEAKQAADETYMQYWYDKSNDITKDWTDKDFALLVTPEYEKVKVVTDSRRGTTKTEERRKLPPNYSRFQEYQKRIDAGVLDFSSEETHKMLINPPNRHGYGKRQTWISKHNPLRQAVEAQADVMKDFLDDAGVPIVQKYEDLEGFDRPDSFRGEGIYLNTGTGAHIDWDAGLKRMQRYQTSPDAELGTYSNVFVRPDPEGIAKPLGVLGALTGNPWIGGAASLAAGGDIEDVLKGAAKSYAIGQVTAPILENTIADLGVDADLFGMEPEKFSESMMDVQTTILEGGDIEKSLIKEFGVPAVKQIAGAVGDMLPDINLPESQLLSDIGDALEPVVNAVKVAVDPIVDVAQKGIDVVQEVTQPISDVTSDIEDVAKEAGREFDEAVLQPVKEGVQAVTEPVVDVVDEIIDAVDSPLGDVLQAGGDLIQGMLGGVVGGQQPQTVSRTPVENIFDKELFKFDTEIKSTQEMLSPMMNLRRYG